MDDAACCGPARCARRSAVQLDTEPPVPPDIDGMRLRAFSWARADADRRGGPVHRVTLSPFRIDAVAVTNARFGEFVEPTGYVTAAQSFGWSFVFGGLLPDDFEDARGGGRAVVAAGVRRGLGAPRGSALRSRRSRGSSRRPRLVGRRAGVLRLGGDAAADRSRVGVRRAGRARAAAIPVGPELEPGGVHRMNVWQGTFPRRTPRPTVGTAPLRSTRTHRTGTGCTTPPATCGSGARTGSRPSTTRRARTTTRRARARERTG